MFSIQHANTPDDLRRAFPVMVQLRPHLSEKQFVEQATRQMETGYLVTFVEDEGSVVAVAGYRLMEMLHWGKALYVDDLVTDNSSRGKGYAGILFDWLVAFAKEHDCQTFHLDSGANPQRWDAHRFYLKKGMNIASFHFELKLRDTL